MAKGAAGLVCAEPRHIQRGTTGAAKAESEETSQGKKPAQHLALRSRR